MVTRVAKISLLVGVALFYTLVVFNNLTDFGLNYLFVRHVLSMDTTFPGNHAMYRALPLPAWHFGFYGCIILWEAAVAVLLWWGSARLYRALRVPASKFNGAKRVPVIALTLSLLLWLIAFLTVGGEWFLMWQSREWNGQEAAFGNFVVGGIVFLILLQPDTDLQP